jgi:uncharacterized paraquat-inducible protein A
MRVLLIANISLLVVFPIAWSAPLMRAGLLPIFGLSEISILSGLAELWSTDVFLALVVAVFAIVAPYVKTIGLLAIQLGLASSRILPSIQWLGRLAMADIFLIAIYIVIAKGVGVGRIETAWGLYLFTAAVLASLAISHLTERWHEAA